MADYASALRDINSPGTGYFVPAVNIISMSIDDITSNYNSLQGQIAMWNDRYNSGNSKEKNNISQILVIQKRKFDDYAQAIKDYNELHTPVPTTADDVTAPATIPASGNIAAKTTEKKNPWLKYLLIGGILVAVAATTYIIIKNRKHGNAG